MHLTLPKIGLSVLVAAMIALAASAGLKHDPGGDIIVHSVAPDTASEPSLASAPRAGPGALYMIQGQQARRLVVWPFAGEPQVIDAQVSSNTLRPDPTGRRILYSTAGALMALDAHAQRVDLIGVLPEDGYPIRAQWSPTGQAVAYVVRQGLQTFAYYTPSDGSQTTVPFMGMHDSLNLDVGWLPDGRPIAIYMLYNRAEGRLSAQYALFDPVTREFYPLPSDTAVIQPWTPWRSPDGAQQVYAPQNRQGDGFRQDCRTGPLVAFGADWLPVAIQSGAYQILFELRGLTMDWPTWLSDGRIVFRGTADDACNTYPSGLYIAPPGGEPAPLATTAVRYTYDQDEKIMWNVVYAVNRAETQIVWAENDPDAQRSTIYRMPLDGSRPPEIIYQTPPVTDPTSYRDEIMILAVSWLP